MGEKKEEINSKKKKKKLKQKETKTKKKMGRVGRSWINFAMSFTQLSPLVKLKRRQNKNGKEKLKKGNNEQMNKYVH